MHKILPLSLLFLFVVNNALAEKAETQPKSNKTLQKAYFKKPDARDRMDILSQAQVLKTNFQTESTKPLTEDEKDNLANKIDVVQYLTEVCGFDYKRDQETKKPIRPEVECTYVARTSENEFNGMMPKFDCRFETVDHNGQVKSRTLKVKYDELKQPGGGSKEVPTGIIGGLTARLLGFHTPTFCPVNLICKDCPNDNPWQLSNQSQAPAANGSRVKFNDVIVVIAPAGIKVVGPKKEPSKEMGFYFESELNKYSTPARKAEHEALTIWVNFTTSRDAGWQNTKLFCLNAEDKGNGRFKCLNSVALFNDYGNAFGFDGSKEKLKVDRFNKKDVLVRQSLRGEDFMGNDKVVTIGAHGGGQAAGVQISAAGRDLFVKAAENITYQQWSDVFNLAQVQVTSDSSVETWISAFKKKIKHIKEFNLK